MNIPVPIALANKPKIIPLRDPSESGENVLLNHPLLLTDWSISSLVINDWVGASFINYNQIIKKLLRLKGKNCMLYFDKYKNAIVGEGGFWKAININWDMGINSACLMLKN